MEVIRKYYPEFFSTIQNKEYIQQEEGTISFVKRFCSGNREEIERYVVNLNDKWKEVEKKVIKRLCKLIDISWDKKCIGYVSILPLYPRKLSKRRFSLFYKDNLEDSIGVSVHEITHFIYFDKWRQMFPSDEDWMFEAPHGIWHLSEILAPILNSDCLIKKYVSMAITESEYMDMKYMDSSISVHDVFYELYKENKSFEKFLEEARWIVMTNNKIF